MGFSVLQILQHNEVLRKAIMTVVGRRYGI